MCASLMHPPTRGFLTDGQIGKKNMGPWAGRPSFCSTAPVSGSSDGSGWHVEVRLVPRRGYLHTSICVSLLHPDRLSHAAR